VQFTLALSSKPAGV